MILSPLPIQKFFGNDGNPLNGGLLFTYVAGTTTKLATYKDSTGGPVNTNPIVLDYRGEANVWLDPALTYKFVLSPANDTDPPTNPIWSVDNIRGPITLAELTQQIIGAALYPILPNESIAGLTTANGRIWVEYGNVMRFGAQGDNVSDDWASIDRCLRANDQRSVSIPRPSVGYKISASLTMYDQNIVGQCKEFVFINPTGNFPCFQNDTAQTISGRLQNITIVYNGGVKPPNDAAHNAQFGIYLRAPLGTSFLDLKDIEVRGALWAFNDDTSGSYGASMENIFARNCKFGFRKIGGTTFDFRKCITLNTDLHFFMQNTLACSLTGCAGDGAAITTGNAGLDFRGCTGFVIDGWDSESNALTGNNSSLFSFLSCTGTITGIVGYLNTQAVNNPDFSSFMLIDNSQLSVNGLKMQFAAGSLVLTGTGTVYGILAQNASQVFVGGSDINPATGGAPTARLGLGALDTSRIYYAGTKVSGTALNSYALFFESGTATLTETGCTTSPSGVVFWSRAGSQVTLYFPDITGTSNTAACTLTGLPAGTLPSRTQSVGGIRIQDNSVRAFGIAQVGTGGTITLFPSAAAGAWTAANTKGIESCSITYSVD